MAKTARSFELQKRRQSTLGWRKAFCTKLSISTESSLVLLQITRNTGEQTNQSASLLLIYDGNGVMFTCSMFIHQALGVNNQKTNRISKIKCQLLRERDGQTDRQMERLRQNEGKQVVGGGGGGGGREREKEREKERQRDRQTDRD